MGQGQLTFSRYVAQILYFYQQPHHIPNDDMQKVLCCMQFENNDYLPIQI